jgi:hypothetical protein
MNSSISSSDAAAWRRFATLFVVLAPALLSGILALAYVVDPYDSGRSSLFSKPGVRYQGPRTAAASRGRDPAFSAAIFGNSHIQLLSPERLKAKSGLDFVQLSIPASGPREQFVVLDWFLRHHREPVRAVILSADLTWCTDDPAIPALKPFPFWLFSRNPLEYAAGLLRYDILEEVPRRFGYLFGGKVERARPDGYWDYEAGYLTMGYKADPEKLEKLEERVPDNTPVNQSGRFPVADRLRGLIGGLDPATSLVLVFPPSYKAALPGPGSVRAQSDRACKDALIAAAAGHARTAVVDWRVDRPENHSRELFFDQTHYRQPVAHALEDDVAAALKNLSFKS